MKLIKTLFILLIAFTITAHAQTIRVAAAANLQSVINVLGNDFKKSTGIAIEPIMGSSGKLVAQISNGAPYDVFLSADMEFPQKLVNDGLAEGEPVVYALGSLIVCNMQEEMFMKDWPTLLSKDNIEKIAIANPKIAPYGKAAEEALTKLKLLDKVKSKLVYGESIAQVNAYITTGVVTVGFTTQALVTDVGRRKAFHWAIVDPKLYSPIAQGMVLLRKSADKVSAQKFYDYMLSPPAKSILKKYGYIVR